MDQTSPGLRPFGCAATLRSVPYRRAPTTCRVCGPYFWRRCRQDGCSVALRAPGRLPLRLAVAGVPPGAAGGGGVRHADGVEVEPVVAGFDEQEDEFVPAVEPVADGLGHRVGLVPDDGVADDPPVVLEGEGDPPGQAEQVLGLHAGSVPAHQPSPDVGVLAARRGAADRVGVAEVEPAGSVVGQDPARLAERGAQGGDVAVRVGLAAVLAGDSIVTLGPVGRAGDDAVGRPVGHRSEDVARVACVQGRGGVAPVDRGDHLPLSVAARGSSFSSGG